MKRILSSAVVLILLCAVAQTVFAQPSGIISFSFSSGGGDPELTDISWQYISLYDKYFLFLPSAADPQALTVSFEADAPVYADGVLLISGTQTDIFADGEEHVLTCADFRYRVNAMFTNAIPAVYINTATGSLDSIHANQAYRESGEMMILSTDGNEMYRGALASIKGRGNVSWSFPKKGYNIKLEKKADLLGMGKAKSWCLIPNYQDMGFVRNHCVYDWSAEIGLPYATESRFVDLYMNGIYYGNYMVTEKVQVDKQRVNIRDLEDANEKANPGVEIESLPLAGNRSAHPGFGCGTTRYVEIPNEPEDISGGYLLEVDLAERYDAEVSGFVSNTGTPVVIKSPEYASEGEARYISTYYQAFEDALLSPTGVNEAGEHYSAYIDLDSFIRMYLLQEFCKNSDAGKTSFFLYKDVGGKLTASPAWDFDNSLSGDATGLPAAESHLVDTFNAGYNCGMTLLAALYNHDDFRSEVARIWHEEISDKVVLFANSLLSENAAVNLSAARDMVRWSRHRNCGAAGLQVYTQSVAQQYSNFALARKSYLDSAFLRDGAGIHYFANGGKKLTVDAKNYPAGAQAVLLDNAFVRAGYRFTGWNTAADGTGFDYLPGDTVTVNGTLRLFAQWESTTQPPLEPTTEPITQPTTQPTTEPTTEPATEPTTQPTTQPAPSGDDGGDNGGNYLEWLRNLLQMIINFWRNLLHIG